MHHLAGYPPETFLIWEVTYTHPPALMGVDIWGHIPQTP
jgi:hypothetical protein